MPLYSLKDVPTPSRYPRPPDYKYMILSTAVIKYIIANTNLPIQNVPRGTLEKSGGCSHMEHFQSLRLSFPKVVCWAAEETNDADHLSVPQPPPRLPC